MKKYTLVCFLFITICNSIIAQKSIPSFLINTGTTITLTGSSFYKPGLHLGGIFGYGISSKKNDALTIGAGYHSFVNKRITSDVVKMIDIKAGFRFFPSAQVAVYLHPNAGIGFFADGSGGKANTSAGVAVGYLPKIGNDNLNIFAAFNKIGFTSGVSLLNLGLGYQFNFRAK